ncbi:MAG: small multi-drug export protein [Clostridiales bacterium]|nr:small multi-drug export protein [Clostridiales bacterium]
MEHLAVFSAAMLPTMGMWESIPIGPDVGLSLKQTYFVALLGSMLPIPFLMAVLYEITGKLWELQPPNTLQLAGSMVQGLTNRETVVLVITAIPCFTANVWVGALAAALMKVSIRKAMPIIAMGDIIAGLIIIILSGNMT